MEAYYPGLKPFTNVVKLEIDGSFVRVHFDNGNSSLLPTNGRIQFNSAEMCKLITAKLKLEELKLENENLRKQIQKMSNAKSIAQVRKMVVKKPQPELANL